MGIDIAVPWSIETGICSNVALYVQGINNSGLSLPFSLWLTGYETPSKNAIDIKAQNWPIFVIIINHV